MAVAVCMVALLTVTACGGGKDASAPAAGAGSDHAPHGTVTLYTSYSQPEVDALVAAYKAETPGVTVSVFRAPSRVS